MKKNNTKSFFAGILFSFVVFISFSFYTNAENQVKTDESTVLSVPGISPETATTYRSNYTRLNPDGLTAINISVKQWEAVNRTANDRNINMSEVSGFRLYFGNKTAEPGSDLVAIPYLINNELNEMPAMGQMQMAEDFSSNYASQCPPFCD